MKRITYLLILCLFAAPSCDLLNRPVYNNIEYSTFYKNERDINLAVIGSYGRLATIYAADYVKYAELPGDNSQALGDTGDNAQLDKFIAHRFELSDRLGTLLRLLGIVSESCLGTVDC